MVAVAISGPLAGHTEPSVTEAGWVEIATEAGPMRAYVATAAAHPKRAVVVLQEAFGVNSHIQSVTNRLAAQGFLAIAPDLFHRSAVDGEPLVVDYGDRDTAMRLIDGLGVTEVSDDLRAVVRHVREQSGDGVPISVVGFCFGARAAFTAGTEVAGLDSVAVFYGPGVAAGKHAVLERVAGITARMLLVFGADDPTIPAEQVTATTRALDAADVAYSALVYPDAGHAFCCDARPQVFHANQAFDAWVRLLDFLAV